MISRWKWFAGVDLRRILSLPRVVAGGTLLLALALGGLLALRVLRPAAPAQILPGQTLAWDIARAVGQAQEVRLASGAYLPGDRLLLYARTDQTDRAHVRSWALVQLQAFGERLAQMPANEQLVWVIDFGVETVEQEALITPVRQAADPARYRYVSAAPDRLSIRAAETATATSGDVDSLGEAVAAPTSLPQPTAAAPQPTAIPAAPDPGGTPLVSTGFDEASGGPWRPLSGDWQAHDGIYSQRDKTGYDMISLLDLAPQEHYRLEARLRLGEGEMGGGFIYNAPSPNERAGAQIIDFDSRGGFLRWGRYDAQGAYVYAGGVAVEPPISDGQWHELRLETHADTSVVSLDGRVVGTVANASPRGSLGLLTSRTTVDFDDVRVTLLPADAPAAPMPAADFSDDFADGDARGWQVLGGTWQIVDGTYRQIGTAGSDLGSSSPFQSDSYTATVRMQRIDGSMGGGIIFNMEQRDTKARSQMINYTQDGAALQWGHFDEGGNYVFEGSAPVPSGGDGAWHTLEVAVADGRAIFRLDKQPVAADVPLTYARGYVGLLVSNSSVAFDDVRIVTR